jgi:predicted aspartyl protease
VPPISVPGKASIEPSPGAKSVVLIRNTVLGVSPKELHVDAILDTGATHCIVSPHIAKLLGFHKGNRLGVERTSVVGGGERKLDRHRLEYVRVGTAKAYNVGLLVADLGPTYKFALLIGLSFIKQFTSTTVNFDTSEVFFRSGLRSK